MEITQVHAEAVRAAQEATRKFLAQNGDRDCCGFAWVTCYEKGTSKFVRELKKLGFRRSYNGGYQLWNPSGSYTQAITAKEVGAQAYADTFKKYYPEVKMYAGSRMD